MESAEFVEFTKYLARELAVDTPEFPRFREELGKIALEIGKNAGSRKMGKTIAQIVEAANIISGVGWKGRKGRPDQRYEQFGRNLAKEKAGGDPELIKAIYYLLLKVEGFEPHSLRVDGVLRQSSEDGSPRSFQKVHGWAPERNIRAAALADPEKLQKTDANDEAGRTTVQLRNLEPGGPPTVETAPFRWPPHVEREQAISENADVDVWLNPHNHHSIPLEGRKNERQLLEEFVNDDRHALSICELIAPSGAGKTRLVSEWMRGYMAKYQENGWDAGFVESRDPGPWEEWVPKNDTLIVIDYTYNFDAVVDVLIDRFERNAPKRVRLLLLDHVKSRDRQMDLALPERVRDGQFLQGAAGLYFKASPVTLEPEPDDSLLLRHVIVCAVDPNTENKRYTIESAPVVRAAEALMTIGAPQSEPPSDAEVRTRDAIRHPLFAALVGQQLREDPETDFTDMTRRDLITQYFDRGRRLPWAMPATGKYAAQLGPWVGCYVAAATLLRGASVRTLEAQLPAEAVRKPLAKQDLLLTLTELSRKIVSGEDQRVIPPYEPDILGEVFVIKFLERFRADDEVMEAFVSMLCADGPSKPDEEAANALQETFQRLVRNLINEDPSAVARSWDAVFEFLQPWRFPIGSVVRQSVSIALGDIAKQCAEAKLHEFVPEAASQIDLEDLEAASVGPQWREAAKSVVHWLERAAPVGGIKRAHYCAVRNTLSNFKDRSEAHWTALMLVAAEGCLSAGKTVRSLFGEDVDTHQDQGRTALMIAAQYGRREMVEWLISEGADANKTRVQSGWTAAMSASLNGHLEVLEFLHCACPDLIAKATNDGWTVAMSASLNGHLAVLEFLRGAYADLIAQTRDDGWTVAMSASWNGHLPVLEFLQEAYPELIVQPSGDGWTAAMAASENGHLAVLEFMHVAYPDLIAKTTDDGRTAAMAASHNGHLAVLEFLHVAYPDLIAKTRDDGRTAAMAASVNGHLAVLEFLHIAYPDLIAKTTDDGRTAAMAASHTGHLAVLEFLHVAYPDLIAKTTDDGWTAAMAASHTGHLAVLEFLHDAYPDLIAQPRNDGWTAALSASYSGYPIVLEFLNGAYPDLISKTTDDDFTTAMAASQNGHLLVLEFLIGAGIDPNATTSDGDTALSLAEANGHQEVVEFLKSVLSG